MSRARLTSRQRSITTRMPAALLRRASCSSHKPCCSQMLFAPTAIAASSTGRGPGGRKHVTVLGTTGSAERSAYTGWSSSSSIVGLTGYSS